MMNKETIITTTAASAITALAILTSCGGKNSENSSNQIPHIDWDSPIPERVIDMNDLADFEYIPLETTDESVIKYCRSFGINDSIIGLCNYTHGGENNILFFDRDGKFKRAINRLGGGPEEYSSMKSMAIDPDNNEISVLTFDGKVYSYNLQGDFKGEAQIPSGMLIDNVINYDKDKFVVWDTDELTLLNPLENNKKPYRYLIVDKHTGDTTSIPLAVSHPIGNGISEGRAAMAIGVNPIIKSNKGVIISDFATDTLYEYSEGRLVPLAVYENIRREPDKIPDFVSVEFATDRYIFMTYIRLIDASLNGVEMDKNVGGEYVFDRKTGEIFKYETSKPYNKSDSRGSFYVYPTVGPDNTYCLTADVENLVNSMEKGKLRPEFVEMTEKFDMEDNPVVIIAKFKE